WTVQLVNPATGAVVATTQTQQGAYQFTDVQPGTYEVREVLQSDWAQTAPGGRTERASVAADGTQADSHSYHPALSGDGRLVAFESDADNLVPGDTSGQRDVFVRDRRTGAVVRVSVSNTGAQADGPSFAPALSADGRFVAFWSLADNLVPGDTNRGADVFIFDLQTHTIERVNVNDGGHEVGGSGFGPALSADGRFVAFESTASDLVPDDTNSASDIFVYDRWTQTVERVSVPGPGRQADGPSYHPALSADGRFVA